MKKSILACIIFCFLTSVSFAQDKKETSYDQFISQSGKIIKFQDYKLTPIKGRFELFETKIRAISAGGQISYYFQIEKKNKYGSIIASISEYDVSEMVKALAVLIQNSNDDWKNNIEKNEIEYLENKFITNDGVQIGYYIKSF